MFDIAELRELTAYDELELDTLGDPKSALFIIISDTDDTFNFLVSLCYTQLFNLLCEKADDVYGGRLPVHVRCLIDECANIGQIPRLEKLMATIRHGHVHAGKMGVQDGVRGGYCDQHMEHRDGGVRRGAERGQPRVGVSDCR